MRTFKGDALFHDTAGFKPEIQIGYQTHSGDLFLRVHNSGKETGSVTITSNAYRDDGPWTMKKIKAGETETQHWNLKKSGDWYDFTVISDNFERRFAGRVETGKDGVSDPAMALHLTA